MNTRSSVLSKIGKNYDGILGNKVIVILKLQRRISYLGHLYRFTHLGRWLLKGCSWAFSVHATSREASASVETSMTPLSSLAELFLFTLNGAALAPGLPHINARWGNRHCQHNLCFWSFILPFTVLWGPFWFCPLGPSIWTFPEPKV